MSNPIRPNFFKPDHNHKQCIKEAITKAESICSMNDLRLTKQRKRILQLVWSSHKPVLAYDLLKSLRKEKDNAEPPTVYRALDFLLKNGLIHKIESMKAYLGCRYPENTHLSQFLICDNCYQVAEINNPELVRIIANQAELSGFKANQQTIEITGLCPSCQTE